MTISRDLMMSILSMDAYNRGYNQGIEGLSSSTGTQVGNATIIRESATTPTSLEVAASFYAIAYTIGTGPGAETAIAYRGTDTRIFELALVDIPIFLLNSFTQSQIAMASQFFRAVDAQTGTAPLSLTGHSRGGALAGITAAHPM